MSRSALFASGTFARHAFLLTFFQVVLVFVENVTLSHPIEYRHIDTTGSVWGYTGTEENSVFINNISDIATKLFVWSFVLHMLLDWIFQNDWIAANKVGFTMIPLSRPAKGDWKYLTIPHKAAWVHASIHLLGLLLIFPWWMALIVAAIHLLIDTRIPLRWWQNFYKQTTTGDWSLHVAIWTDQALHTLVIAIAALIVGR